MVRFLVALAAASLLAALASAVDPSAINDFCVADPKNMLMFNGLPCKSPAMVMSEDFAFRGFQANADTNNSMGIGIIPGFAGVNYGALNTMSFALAKFNYAFGGLVPPHVHPRASEVITVLEGELYVGFVDTSGKLFAVTLKTNDFFLFPQGLVHFQLNTGSGISVSVSVLNAQNPGVLLIASALFGSTPAIDTKILSKTFGISDPTTNMIKKGFMPPM